MSYWHKNWREKYVLGLKEKKKIFTWYKGKRENICWYKGKRKIFSLGIKGNIGGGSGGGGLYSGGYGGHGGYCGYDEETYSKRAERGTSKVTCKGA